MEEMARSDFDSLKDPKTDIESLKKDLYILLYLSLLQ
jgi:hypothetical protein